MSTKHLARDLLARPSALSVRIKSGEALDSFLERWAQHQGLSLANAMAHWPDVDSPRRLQIHPTDEFIEHASIVTQVEPSVLRSMTTAHEWIAAQWISQTDLEGLLRYPGRRSWTPTDLSPLCPNCLTENGYWHLTWRMPWTFMCTQHNIMLVDSCSVCRELLKTPSSRLPHTQRPRTKQRVTAYNHFRCQEPQSLTGTPASETAAATQNQLTELAHHSSSKTSLAEPNWAADVRSLAALTLSLAVHDQPEVLGNPAEVQRLLESEFASHHTSRRRWVKKAPVNSELRGLALRAALIEKEGLRAQSTDTPVLRALRKLDLDGAALASWIDDHTSRAPSVDQIREIAGQQRQGTSHQLDRVHQQTFRLFEFEFESIPQLFWPCSTPTTYLTSPARPTTTMRLAVLSLSVIRAATGNWTRAAEALQFPSDRGPQWARYVLGHLSKECRAEIAPWTSSIIGQLSKAPTAQRAQVQGHADLRNVARPACTRELPGSTWCPCLK